RGGSFSVEQGHPSQARRSPLTRLSAASTSEPTFVPEASLTGEELGLLTRAARMLLAHAETHFDREQSTATATQDHRARGVVPIVPPAVLAEHVSSEFGLLPLWSF